MLTTFDTDENLYAALRVGTSGFLLKVSPPQQLLEAVRVVFGGDALLDPAVTTRVIASFAGRHDPVPSPQLAGGDAPEVGGVLEHGVSLPVRGCRTGR